MRQFVEKAGEEKCDLVCFDESVLPGYPFWLASTDGSKFDDPIQKEIHARYQGKCDH